MKRNEILGKANQYVSSDRNVEYGEPEDNFGTIARLWADAAVECIEKIDDWNNHFCYHDLEEIIDEWRGVKEEME